MRTEVIIFYSKVCTIKWKHCMYGGDEGKGSRKNIVFAFSLLFICFIVEGEKS